LDNLIGVFFKFNKTFPAGSFFENATDLLIALIKFESPNRQIEINKNLRPMADTDSKIKNALLENSQINRLVLTRLLRSISVGIFISNLKWPRP